ncbi:MULTISPECIES: hypothetical protein [unclassified Streptomyces]|uniref:hypothetical protein n=1 Tax=unclassified Streptomyces TaxID=2593676 RepID=UPI0001C1B5E7|nr:MULTISPECIES: hypothetical protein [unclassified Streptomyces]AEN08509.1 hypothetical protein SACTE_0569 [Streptomyces sp. SirexAA-E]MYR69440.1 hypothetical protein [Streptomyces sp. SID4939]MYS01199.1 hypothetical protein [Streptomyces sp. SID4940]MYT66346.1 hypothetical protein [Streptomyces sp. SID8357]MYT83266.1 hypothetical protein [Streptomyces sp. SID8360]
MADGFIRWYRESAATSVFAEQAEVFEKYGIMLRHPVRGAAVVLDVEGDDVLVPEEELGRLLALRIASVTMNWWLSADTDVTDQYVYEPLGCEIQTLWLDGLYPDEARRVEAAVVEAVAALDVPTRAVIVDRRGVSDPADWDPIMLYGAEKVPPVPDGVIAQGRIAEKILRASPHLGSQDLPGGLRRLTPA